MAGIDVGGTNIEAGLVGDDHRVLDRAKAPTPADGPDAVMDTIAELVGSLDGRPDAVGLGIPGVVHEGEVLTVPNLQNWHESIDIETRIVSVMPGMPARWTMGQTTLSMDTACVTPSQN